MSAVKHALRDATGTHGAAERLRSAGIDVGRPVEWMVDPDRPDTILGVTYAFSLTGERRTVWYTPDEREARVFRVVSEIPAT